MSIFSTACSLFLHRGDAGDRKLGEGEDDAWDGKFASQVRELMHASEREGSHGKDGWLAKVSASVRKQKCEWIGSSRCWTALDAGSGGVRWGHSSVVEVREVRNFLRSACVKRPVKNTRKFWW